eukprot:4540568-Amphidinium_carterae.1
MTRFVDTRALGKPREFKSVRERIGASNSKPVWSKPKCRSSVGRSWCARQRDSLATTSRE